MPAILKIERQLAGHTDAIGRAKTIVADGLKTIGGSGDPAAPSLASCLFSYDKATVEGTASLLESYPSATQVSAAARAK